MSDSKAGQELVVLLGAGASRDAGLPLTLDLTDDLQKELAADGDDLMLTGLNLVLAGLAFGGTVSGRYTSPRADIETVLRTAQQLSTRYSHPLSNYVATWTSRLEAISPGGDPFVFDALVRRGTALLRDKLAVPADSDSTSYLAELQNLGKPFRSVDPPAVFTLNYDLCVETALVNEQIPYTTGFKDGFWSPSNYGPHGQLSLYKLHGSFGWVRHPQTGQLFERASALASTQIDIASDDTEDELVFATESKLRAVQPYITLLYEFSKRVEAARYVAVIGYGFGDQHINELISEAMASDPTKFIIAVGPSVDEALLERAPGFRLFPERTRYISDTAKSALGGKRLLRAQLTQMEQQIDENDPFSAP